MSGELCLYRCHQQKSESMGVVTLQACYPGAGKDHTEGKVITEPFCSPDGKFHKYTVVKCKWPVCGEWKERE